MFTNIFGPQNRSRRLRSLLMLAHQVQTDTGTLRGLAKEQERRFLGPLFVHLAAPWMIQYGLDADTPVHVAVEHLPDQVDTVFAHHIRHAEVVIHDLVNRVERILLVDNGVEQNPKSPDVLLFAAVWGTTENLRCSVICDYVLASVHASMPPLRAYQWCQRKHQMARS